MGAPVALVALQSIGTAGSKAKVATFDLNLDAANAIKDGKIALAVDAQPYLQATSPSPRCGSQDEWQRHRRWAVALTGPAIGRAIEHRGDSCPSRRHTDRPRSGESVLQEAGAGTAAALDPGSGSPRALLGKALRRRELSALSRPWRSFILFWVGRGAVSSWAAMGTSSSERHDRVDGRLSRCS